MQPNNSFHQVLHVNTRYLCIFTQQRVQMVPFMPPVEINVHDFNVHLTRGQTNKTTHKQTQWHMHTPTYKTATHIP